MTNPIGHPDWQTYSQWRGPTFVNQSVTALANSTTVVGTFAVSHFASLVLYVKNVVGGGTISFQYSEDGTTFITGFGPSWRIWQGSAMNVTVPILGNFVRVVVSAPVANSFVGDITLVPTNVTVPRNQYQGSEMDVHASGVNIAAGGTSNFQLPAIAEGFAYARLDPLGVANQLSIIVYALSETGAGEYIVWRRDKVAAAVDGQFLAPQQSLLVQLVNADVVAHTCDMFAMVDVGN